MGRLTSYVHVPDDNGGYTVVGPDDDVPENLARRIGAHAWEDGQHPYPDDADGDGNADRAEGEEPPRSGKGSGRDAWVAFAGEKDQADLVDGKSRDEIIQALADAGVIDQ